MLVWLAMAPVAVVLVLMLAARWSAARAGLLGAAVALAVAVTAFDFGGRDDSYGWWGGLVGVLAEAGFISLTVVLIIGPALGIHHLQQRSGATDRLRDALAALTPDPRVAALLIAWFFALFMEGAAGFGTPVALAAPFLVAAGFTPIAAVTAALIGHATGVSFGAVGTPVAAQVGLTGIGGGELAAATARYHLLLGWVLVAVLVMVISRTVAGIRLWGWGLLAGAAFLVPYWAIAEVIGPELPTLGGALVGAVVFVVVLVWVRRSGRSVPPPAAGLEIGRRPMGVATAAAPYLTVIALVLVTRLVGPVNRTLAEVRLAWTLEGGFAGSVQPLTHPALLLTVAFGVGAIVQRADLGTVAGAFWAATRLLAPVVVALLAMVTIARTMSQAGMTEELAVAATGLGAGWPLVAPLIGALGAFVTGSATASNILFSELQQETAAASGLDEPAVLGAQGYGAAVGNLVCPHNIVAAAATVGESGNEAAVLRRTFPPVLVCVTLGGLLAWWFAT